MTLPNTANLFDKTNLTGRQNIADRPPKINCFHFVFLGSLHNPLNRASETINHTSQPFVAYGTKGWLVWAGHRAPSLRTLFSTAGMRIEFGRCHRPKVVPLSVQSRHSSFRLAAGYV